MKNPRFCGFELEREDEMSNSFSGYAHSNAFVRVFQAPGGQWSATAHFGSYGVQVGPVLYAASPAAALLSLRGTIRDLQRSLLPFEPKSRTKAAR